MNSNMGRYWRLLIIALVLVLGGSLLGSWIQTGAGAAQVKEVKYLGAGNAINDAYLWIPSGVTAEHPAPAVLAAHGFNNSKEYMSNTALELARRGYVVLSIDMDDHGKTEPSNLPPTPLGAPSPNGIGTLDALKYLRSLDIVDKDNIGMVGMSMGGMAIDATAMLMPDGYEAMFFMDSGCTAGCPTDKNFAISVGKQTELSAMNGGALKGADVPLMPANMEIYGTDQPIVLGQVYGSIQDGTGKVLYDHFGDHALSTDDPTTIGNVIRWFGMTLVGARNNLPPSNQIWPLKLVGTGAAFLGLVLFLFAAGALLLQSSLFESLKDEVPAYKGPVGLRWWVFAIITALLGPVTFQWLFPIGFNANWFKLESVSTGFTYWLFVVGVITIALLLVGHYALARRAGATAESYGLTWEGGGIDWRKIGKSLVFALCVLGMGYFLLWLVNSWLKVDFRLWVLTLKVTDLRHFFIMLAYVVPLAVYFVPLAVVLHGTLRPKNGEASIAREMITNVAVLWIGVLGLLAIFYVPLTWMGVNAPPFGGMPLGMINFIALIVLIPVIATLSTFFFRKTGRVYVGSFLCTLFVTWYLVAANTTFAIG
jgi:pimeloyl-ACP methyl ester carboxylesterase